MLTMLFVLFELVCLAGIVGIIGWWLEHDPNECAAHHCILAHEDVNA
jgi:hypothetical protein